MKTLAITGGKGGVGKTTLSANLGVCLAQLGYRTTVFDADLALANLEIILGVRAEYSLQHVVAEEKCLSEIVAHGPAGVGYIAGGSGIPTLMRSGPKKLGMFFDQIMDLESETDFLIYDTSAGIDNKVMAFIKNSDEVILVTTPQPAAVTDAYATIKAIFRAKKDARIRVVVNMAETEIEALEVYKILERISFDFLKKEIEFVGFVRQDESVNKCSKSRKPYVIADKKSTASLDTLKVAKELASSLASNLEKVS